MAITLLRQFNGKFDQINTAKNTIDDFILERKTNNSTFALVSSGRSALYFFIKNYWPKQGQIMMPAYVAEGVISPFIRANIPVVFYRVNEMLFPDLDDVKIQLKKNPLIKGFVLIHPLGFEAPADEIKILLEKYNVFFIEDCAQGMFSQYKNGGFFGLKGDFSLYSFNKFLPVPDGAVLMSHNQNIHISCNKNQLTPICQEAISHYMNHLYLNHEVINSDHVEKCEALVLKSNKSYEKYYQLISRKLDQRSLSAISENIFENINHDQLKFLRQRNCKLLYKNLKHPDIGFVYTEYNDNIVPMAVPVLVPRLKRNLWSDSLRKKGIYLSTLIDKWNFLPKEKNERHANEIKYIQSHLLIPINEFIAAEEIHRMIFEINQLR